MISPTVGRVVHYFPGANDVRLFSPGMEVDKPYAAIVVDVANNRLISVCAFGRNGYPQPRVDVALLQDDDRRPTDGSAWCEWMEYQKGQAKKTEEAEAALRAGAVGPGPAHGV